MISIIHPSRGRPKKSFDTIGKWLNYSKTELQIIISVDYSDSLLDEYLKIYSPLDKKFGDLFEVLVSHNETAVQAINRACVAAVGDTLIVVSDDTDCFPGWDTALLKALEGKSDYLLKTDDGIQDYIVTMTVCDRTYLNRDGYIYHPDFFHQFADTYQTCKADIRGRLIYSKLKFPHLHYSYSGGKEMPDALNHRNDLSWKVGQDTFIKLMKEFTAEERSRITNKGMRGFLKRVGL